MLSSLISGHVASAEPSGSDLSSLVAGAAAKPMSLPQALNALRRGEFERPIDGAIGEVLAPDMPAQPAPSPQPLSYEAELDEARIDARVDRDAMRDRIRRKRDELQASALYSADPRANLADSRRRHQITARLDEAERQLMEMENG